MRNAVEATRPSGWMQRCIFLLAAGVTFCVFPNLGCAKESPVVSVISNPTGMRVFSLKTGKVMIPGIDIYADGLVSIRRYDGTEQNKKLRENAVKSLVHSLDKTGFYRVTEQTFQDSIEKRQPNEKFQTNVAERIFITDCPDWTLKIRKEKVVRTTKFNGLWDYAKVYPKNALLKILKNAISQVYAAGGEAKELSSEG